MLIVLRVSTRNRIVAGPAITSTIPRTKLLVGFGPRNPTIVEVEIVKEAGMAKLKGRFQLGWLVATPGALAALEASGDSALKFLNRHVSGDWGDLDAHDKAENEFAVNRHLRIFSAYVLTDGTKIWIITEADRSATTILLPSEY